MLKTINLILLLLATTLSLHAEDNLVMKFDFSNVSSKNVTDEISGITAKMVGSAKVEQMGTYNVMELGSSNGYLDMTADAGTTLASLTNFSISCYYFVADAADITANGNFLWTFSTSTACSSTAGSYHAYRINAQRAASSTAGYSNEVGFELGSASTKGRWVHVCYTQSSKTGRLYIDGKMVNSLTTMPTLSTLFGTAPQYCWLGRAPFSGDAYLAKTKIYDFCLYNKALTLAAIKEKAALTADLDYQYRYGTPGNFTKLQTAITTAETNLATYKASGKYAQSALDDYEDVIAYSRYLLEEGKVSQPFIDQQVTTLTTAKNAVTASANFVFSTENLENSYDTERGFRHPGGLHTQADFDRIKRQIEEGNSQVVQAYNVLKSAAYAQSTASTNPVETIVRGGGTGENYINACRGAAIAYQNALRWKIEGNKACANHAVAVLNQWAKTTKAIGGDSNYALAAGLYGYEFAQAAELVRDYEGWKAADFKAFQRWMLDVWYPSAIGFLRGRNGTWENVGKWWQSPGHYWSNWGLCNALCVISIGVLCDDVNIYNQGMSYIKYDQVGTYKDVRTEVPIKNDGLAEFWGNLIVTTSDWDQETGAYGKVGQMNESGRDAGHSVMALGLAVDIAQQGWNQGDDLFSYMDHRLAAGIEYVAAQTQSVPNLPWTDYIYGSSGYYYTDSRCWTMTEPAMGAQMRPYWGTVIGHYEGIKGVKMPFSEVSLKNMGIDGGGQGSTSGGYDHLGYSVLMHTQDGMADRAKAPVELVAKMVVNGKTIMHNELGMLTNTYSTTPLANRGVAKGTIITLSPTLPEGVEDTGKWQWETGETTRELTIVADASHIYRVHYISAAGTESEQSYAIAVVGDGQPTTLTPTITYNGTETNKTTIEVDYGQNVTLSLKAMGGYGEFEWENGAKTATRTVFNVIRDREITGCFVNQAGRRNYVTFTLKAKPAPVNTAIEHIGAAPQSTAQDAIYDLSGHRIAAPVQGQIYIKNGKKIRK